MASAAGQGRQRDRSLPLRFMTKGRGSLGREKREKGGEPEKRLEREGGREAREGKEGYRRNL
jgi:hypothetical protein